MTKKSLFQAKKLYEHIDVKDISFVALAIDTGLVLLTRDEKFVNQQISLLGIAFSQ